MTLSINNSSSSIGLTRNLGLSWGRLKTHMSHLSSGLRINSAAEGPAALVISEHLRSQVASLQQEIENTSHLISKYQSADSTLSMARSQLNEIKSLAIGASNEAFYDDNAIDALQSSAQYLESSFNQMVTTAEFNGKSLFDGSEGSVAEIDQVQGVDFSSPEATQATIDTIDTALQQLDQAQVEIGAKQKNELESRKASLEVTRQNLVAAESQIRDADYGQEIMGMTMEMIKSKASIALMAHSRVNGSMILSLLNAS